MDPAQMDRVEKLEKVYAAVCDFLKWRDHHRRGQRSGCGFYEDDEDVLYGNVRAIMGVEIEEYN